MYMISITGLCVSPFKTLATNHTEKKNLDSDDIDLGMQMKV